MTVGLVYHTSFLNASLQKFGRVKVLLLDCLRLIARQSRQSPLKSKPALARAVRQGLNYSMITVATAIKNHSFNFFFKSGFTNRFPNFCRARAQRRALLFFKLQVARLR